MKSVRDDKCKFGLGSWSLFLGATLILTILAAALTQSVSSAPEECRDKCSDTFRDEYSTVHEQKTIAVNSDDCRNIEECKKANCACGDDTRCNNSAKCLLCGGNNKIVTYVTIHRDVTLKTTFKDCEKMKKCKKTGCAATGEIYSNQISQDEVSSTIWEVGPNKVS
jgi:hypothetical protein